MQFGPLPVGLNGAVSSKVNGRIKKMSEPKYLRNFSVRLDESTTKKLQKLAKQMTSQNQVFVQAINVLFDQANAPKKTKQQ